MTALLFRLLVRLGVIPAWEADFYQHMWDEPFDDD